MSYLLFLLVIFLQCTGCFCDSHDYVPTWAIVCLALVGAVLILMFCAFALVIALRRRQ